jgi:hypothetical protein
MQTKFVELDLPRSALTSGPVRPAEIEKFITDQGGGEALRWAITRTDLATLHIEAILTTDV